MRIKNTENSTFQILQPQTVNKSMLRKVVFEGNIHRHFSKFSLLFQEEFPYPEDRMFSFWTTVVGQSLWTIAFTKSVSSVAQLCWTLCNPMDCSTPGFPVHLEPAQTHVHRVNDAIQPSHPLSSPSSAFNLSQHQGLFQLVSSSHNMAKELQLQHQTLFPFRLTGLISLKSKGLFSISSNTTVQKHQFFSAQLSFWFNSHIHI